MRVIFKLSSKNRAGFTLIELLLAMTLFTTVMVVATVGFIAMNRGFNRGLIRKQLSEAVQSVNEDITRSVRAEGAKTINAVNCSGTSGGSCPPNGWEAICLGRTRYVWKSAETGLYKDLGPCSASVNINNSTLVLSERFSVKKFTLTTVNLPSEITNEASGIVRVQGLFTTNTPSALTTDQSGDPICKGSAENSAVNSCATESFNFLITARGKQ